MEAALDDPGAEAGRYCYQPVERVVPLTGLVGQLRTVVAQARQRFDGGGDGEGEAVSSRKRTKKTKKAKKTKKQRNGKERSQREKEL